MSGSHHHSHDHDHLKIQQENLNRAFYIGIFLNIVFVVIEAVYGFAYNSLSLVSDAGHNLSDVAGLVLALIAFKLMKKKATENYTYGFRKASILTSLINAVILLFAVGFIVYEAIQRFFHPQPLQGNIMAVVAFVGILVNGFTAYLFMKDKERDLNVKGAYLHMLADALVSVAVVVGGIVIMYTQWYWIDTVLSLVVAVVIFLGTWDLLTKSLKLSLDGVPEDIKIENVRNEMMNIPGVLDVQHIHIWAMSTQENALTAHVRLKTDLSSEEVEQIKDEIRHELQHLNIQHSTLETYFCEKNFEDEI